MTMKTKRKYSDLTKKIRTVAIASEYTGWLEDREPCPVVILLRESSRSQAGNLPPQLARVKEPLQERGFRIVGILGGVALDSSTHCLPRLRLRE